MAGESGTSCSYSSEQLLNSVREFCDDATTRWNRDPECSHIWEYALRKRVLDYIASDGVCDEDLRQACRELVKLSDIPGLKRWFA